MLRVSTCLLGTINMSLQGRKGGDQIWDLEGLQQQEMEGSRAGMHLWL